ncbi:MAG: S41 family peptidase [Arcobacteraceae bacterium]|jgi:carboxyl-terminal processing protease|nr:S41 family peptidase [Arcobacteraceae bacterium]MDY0364232.1 S41 family peptidase [Arcobacteraceae bacterium]
MFYRFLFVCLFVFSALSFAQNAPLSNEEAQSRLESLSKLTKILGTVEKYYVDDIKLQEVVDKAIKGLLQELDAHSAYMDSKTFKEMQVQMKGEFGGLGIVVGMRDSALTVISPIDDTPAARAGIKSGDIIIKIDDKSTLNMTLDEAVKHMKGEPNTEVDITIVRKNENKPLVIGLKRAIIDLKSVSIKTIENDMVYLRVSTFDEKVVSSVKEQLPKYLKNAKGIVLDLRNNPGGALKEAIGLVDLFVDSGVIVSQRGRNPQDEEKHFASKLNTMTKLPMVVLINGGSASASEIVSGSLQDHKRAIVVGEKSFGKGSVQVVLPLDEKESEAIKLTIARYYLPSGRSIQAVGVDPDIVAYEGEAVRSKEDDLKIKEADLKKHLEGELDKANGNSKEETTKTDESSNNITQNDLFADNQLRTATDVLQALILIQK